MHFQGTINKISQVLGFQALFLITKQNKHYKCSLMILLFNNYDFEYSNMCISRKNKKKIEKQEKLNKTYFNSVQ